jgi:hypothetical protein
MTAELNSPEAIEHIFENTQNFKPRPCPYFFVEDEDDFEYFKW